jgi:glycosyltransferase involved in cell wall biosynthesis
VLIGFGADNIADERKGMLDLLTALDRLPPELEVEAIAFGAGKLPRIPEGIKRVHELGFISEPERQSLVYSACDFVVVPSREDNQPSVGLESLACGTPVVGTRAGGIPEYVQEGITGLLAGVGDQIGLAERIAWLAANPEARQVMGQRGRMMVQREFEITRQTGIYRQLYAASLAATNVNRSRRAA